MNAEDLIMKLLMESKVIPQGFTGQVILNIGSGGLCSVERWEKNGLKRNLQGMNEKIFSSVLLRAMGGLANNAA
jgi:hypothetical protein